MTLPPFAEEIEKRMKAATAQMPLEEESRSDDGKEYCYHCPYCDGIGTFEADAEEKTFFTKNAAGIQVFGLGDDLVTMENFVLHSPEDIQKLLEALRVSTEALKRIESYGPYMPFPDQRLPHELANDALEKLRGMG